MDGGKVRKWAPVVSDTLEGGPAGPAPNPMKVRSTGPAGPPLTG